jgi:eukaryotic-like serine/threonine-protein kinase
MPFDTVDALLAELRKSRLLKVPQLDDAERMLKPRFSAPMMLAKELVRRGWLTVYQMNQLFQANGQQLILGPYQILDHLGKGGVSQVFKAWHAERNALVALKVIHPHLLSNAEAVARFQREMKTVARLSHPNIVDSFSDDSIGEAHFFAMEFVEGTALDKLVQLSGALPVQQACDFTRQAALGLQHAHEQGLVHRDIKPANLVQISGTALIKILDFGLARLHRSDGSDRATSLTLEGALIGTADYVAPEQARDARSVDIRADIYSLGCTFYYLLTGAPPFPGGSLMQKIYNHLNKEPTPVNLLRPDAPPEVGPILKKMMAKKIEDRYATPQEVAEALAPLC